MGQAPKTGRRQRKLTNLLLDRKFQLKYTGMIVALSSTISVALGFFLVAQMRENSRMLQLEAELDAVFQEQLAQSDAYNLLVMVGTLVLFNVALGLSGIFVTHRMAGPIFVIRRYVRMIGEGKLPLVRSLRKGDEFGDVIEDMQSAVSNIEARTIREIEQLREIKADIEGSASESTVAKLDELVEARLARLPED